MLIFNPEPQTTRKIITNWIYDPQLDEIFLIGDLISTIGNNTPNQGYFLLLVYLQNSKSYVRAFLMKQVVCNISDCECFQHLCARALGRKVEVLEVLRVVGDIFSPNDWLLRQKKCVKMASIRNSCDRFPCEIAQSLKPFGSCHKQCIHSLGLAII